MGRPLIRNDNNGLVSDYNFAPTYKYSIQENQVQITVLWILSSSRRSHHLSPGPATDTQREASLAICLPLIIMEYSSNNDSKGILESRPRYLSGLL